MGDAKMEEPLLERVYFENCPGCKIDRKKDANLGMPYKEFFYVWIVTLTTGKPIFTYFGKRLRFYLHLLSSKIRMNDLVIILSKNIRKCKISLTFFFLSYPI